MTQQGTCICASLSLHIINCPVLSKWTKKSQMIDPFLFWVIKLGINVSHCLPINNARCKVFFKAGNDTLSFIKLKWWRNLTSLRWNSHCWAFLTYFWELVFFIHLQSTGRHTLTWVKLIASCWVIWTMARVIWEMHRRGRRLHVICLDISLPVFLGASISCSLWMKTSWGSSRCLSVGFWTMLGCSRIQPLPLLLLHMSSVVVAWLTR